MFLLLINSEMFNTNFKKYFYRWKSDYCTVYIHCKGRGSGYSCFMIFASLLMIHCLKPAHSSLPMLIFIWVQFCSRNRTGRSLNQVFFLCFRLFIPTYSALSSFFIHLNPVQKLMISKLMIMLNLIGLCRQSVVSLLVLQSTTQFTLVIHTSISENKTGYGNPVWTWGLSAFH